ncbi:MAG: hypothetical protein P1V97_32370 [Planctomycetota bacterium]|nr:hypothetical protein [Planctomycetota bacterium]
MTENASKQELAKFELIPEDRQALAFSFQLNEKSSANDTQSTKSCPACLAPFEIESETLSCTQDHLSVHKECADTVILCPYPGCGGELLEEFPLASTAPELAASTAVEASNIKAQYRCPACFDDVQNIDSVASCGGRHFYVHLDCLELLSDCPAVGCNQKLAEVEKLEAPRTDVIRLSSADVRSIAIVNERLLRRRQRRARLARLREPLTQQRAARRARQIAARAESLERQRRFIETAFNHKKKLGLLCTLLFSLILALYNPSFLPNRLRVELAGFFQNKEVLIEVSREENDLAKAGAISKLSAMNDLSRQDIAEVCLAVQDSSPVVETALAEFISKHKDVAASVMVTKMLGSPKGQARTIELLEAHKTETSRAILDAMHHPTIHFNRRAMTDVLIEFQPESIPVLIAQLSRNDNFHNERVVEILQEISIDAEADLLGALESSDPQLRKYAIRCLKVNSRTRPLIQRALKDESVEVREEAAKRFK